MNKDHSRSDGETGPNPKTRGKEERPVYKEVKQPLETAHRERRGGSLKYTINTQSDVVWKTSVQTCARTCAHEFVCLVQACVCLSHYSMFVNMQQTVVFTDFVYLLERF